MKKRLAHGFMGCLAVALMLAAAPGCRKEETSQKELVKAEGEAEKAVDTKAAVEAKLARADQFDGKTDKVVSKCASCALGMDGKSEHALEISGYTLHFCSEYCKTSSEKETMKVILALKIPGN